MKKQINNKNFKENIELKAKNDCIEIAKNISGKIKNQRLALGFSMADLYKISGVSSSTINDIEKARYIPNIEVLLKLGYALNLSRKEVLNAFESSGASKKIIREGAWNLIKIGLRNLDIAENEVKEILDYIEFKGGGKLSPIEFFK